MKQMWLKFSGMKDDRSCEKCFMEGVTNSKKGIK